MMARKIYRCFNCLSPMDARKTTCPVCKKKQPYEDRAEFLNRDLIDIECPKCGCKKSFYATSAYFNISSCCECGAETSCEDKAPLPMKSKSLGIKCPYCGSFNTKKISTTSKVAYGATFGIFAASKIANQWHCNNCKSDF